MKIITVDIKRITEKSAQPLKKQKMINHIYYFASNKSKAIWAIINDDLNNNSIKSAKILDIFVNKK